RACLRILPEVFEVDAGAARRGCAKAATPISPSAMGAWSGRAVASTPTHQSRPRSPGDIVSGGRGRYPIEGGDLRSETRWGGPHRDPQAGGLAAEQPLD